MSSKIASVGRPSRTTLGGWVAFALLGLCSDVAFTADSNPVADAAATTEASSTTEAAETVDRDGGSGFVEEITVTGQQRERSLEETTASVAVVTAEDLAASTVTDLYDVVDAVPNVHASQGGKGFSIRGIDQRGFGSGTGLLVNVEVDGVSLHNDASTYFGPYSTWDLQQVEVFRGPQSTQKGRNSLAGAIILRGRQPTYEHQAATRFSYGELDSWQAAAMVNVPLVADKLAFRLAVDQRRSDGWVENPTRSEDDYDFRDLLNVRGKLRFDPSDRFHGMLSFTYADNRGGEDIIASDLFPTSRFNLSDETAEEGSEHQMVALELSYLLNDHWSLKSTSTLYRHEYLRIEDTDQSPFPGNRLDQGADDESVSQQVRLLYDGGGKVQGVFGLYLADLNDDNLSAATLPGTFFGLPDFVSITGTLARREETENRALFGEVDLQLSERWTLTAGARFDQEEKRVRSAQSFTLDPPVIALPAQPPEDLSSDYDAFLPKVALTYRLSAATAVGVSAQRGYRAGGRSIAFISQQVSDFDPETTDNYEVFLRSRSADGRWQLDANVFYIDWQDQQVAVRTDLGLENDVLTVNAGSSRLQGLEAELRGRPHKALELSAAVGWVDAEFVDFVDGGADFSGNEFPFAPSWSTTLGLRWQIAERWDLDARWLAQGSYFSDPSNVAAFEVDGRNLVHLRLGYRQGTWGAHLFVRNLLDEDYLVVRLPEGSRSGEPQVVGLRWTWAM